jgi:hypothetical protein
MLKKLIKIIVYHNGSDSSELFDNTNHAIEILTNNPLRFTIKKKGEYSRKISTTLPYYIEENFENIEDTL